jgi:hypothetical protein
MDFIGRRADELIQARLVEGRERVRLGFGFSGARAASSSERNLDLPDVNQLVSKNLIAARAGPGINRWS